MFGKGYPFTVDDLPPGRTREKLESLPEPARRRAMEWLHSFELPAEDVDFLIVTDDARNSGTDHDIPARNTGRYPPHITRCASVKQVLGQGGARPISPIM